jgi:glycosyltransferase involved in cell wall biosynthesis
MGEMKHPPVTIYNGINTALFNPRENSIRKELGIPENSFVIFSAAYVWDARKNPELFLQLSKKLVEDVTIVLVGQGLENVNAPNIIRLNRTESQDELARLYSAADVFINASMEETFGLTTAEALACGTPAIVFNSTACPEIVDEHTGIVAEHTVDGLLKAVQQIREKGKEAYRDACVKRVKEHFDETRMVNEYLALYRRILNEQ